MVSRNNILSNTIKNRFRGFLPVVVDVETAGIDPQKMLSWKCVLFYWIWMSKAC
ncbi:hypothetical protein PGH46_03135 [Legionella pneumophila]|nr:hypothetical protein PGH46_03135 [Legionella pneumophila]